MHPVFLVSVSRFLTNLLSLCSFYSVGVKKNYNITMSNVKIRCCSLTLSISFNDTKLVQYKTCYGMFDVSIFMIDAPHSWTWIVYYEKPRNWDWNITNVIGIEINIPLSDNFGPKQMSHHPWTDWVAKSTEDHVCCSLRGANGSPRMTT